MDPAFSEKAALQQEPIIQNYVKILLYKLRVRSSSSGKTTVNIVEWIDITLFDIIGDLCFGESFGCLEKCEYEPWMDQMAASIKLNYLSINIRHFPIINSMLKPLAGFLIPPEIMKQHKDYRDRATAKLDRRLNSTAAADRQDVVSQILKSENHAEGLTPNEVLLNLMQFINAASETTATILTGIVNHLQNPTSLANLENEVRQFSSPSDLTLSVLKQFPYVNAVPKEGLRMCNPT
jgi:cytochrome P450